MMIVMTESKEKQGTLEKLNRVAGRINGLKKMIEEDRPVMDILIQLSSTHEALRVISKSMIKSYLSEKIATGLNSTQAQKREETYEEVLSTLYKFVK